MMHLEENPKKNKEKQNVLIVIKQKL